MPQRRSLITLGAFASTILLAASTVVATGFTGRTANRQVPIVASAPTPITVPLTEPPTTAPPTTAAPTTTTPPPTTAPTAPPTTVARTTLPPTTPPPRPPTTPAAPRVTVTTAPRPVAVKAPPAPSLPGGSPSDYSLIGYRWNPCEVITVSSSGPDVTGVVAELVAITGLQIQTVSSGGQISVGWGATPAGGEVGQTDWRSVGSWMVSANVTLNQLGIIYLPTLLRHELGHALGLGHSARADQIMYGLVGLGSPTAYQAGDLAGLHAVGASAGC